MRFEAVNLIKQGRLGCVWIIEAHDEEEASNLLLSIDCVCLLIVSTIVLHDLTPGKYVVNPGFYANKIVGLL